MIRLIAVAFALALASSAQAIPRAPPEPADNTVIQVRQGCGLGRQLVDGVCVKNAAVRKMVRKCRLINTCPGGKMVSMRDSKFRLHPPSITHHIVR